MSDTQTQLFGTDGIRARYGDEPLTPASLRRVGRAISHALEHLPKVSRARTPKRVLIGRDTRVSGPDIAQALSIGLEAAGYETLDLGVLPTPGVAYCVRNIGAAAGIVISASHNPAQDNGVKLFGPDGFKLADELEAMINQRFTTTEALDDGSPQTRDSHAHTRAYSDHLEACARSIIDKPKPLAGLKLVIDGANGAASTIAPAVFEELGAEVTPLACSGEGEKINADCGALHPGNLAAKIQEHKADAGITLDGDADRVMLVGHAGTILDGDYMLTLLARWLQAEGSLNKNCVVGTVMANLGLELALSDLGIHLIRESVGDRNVVARMLREDSILGGEQSGHIIHFSRGSTTGDGLFTAINILARALKEDKDLESLAGLLTKYPQVLVNIPVKEKPAFEAIAGLQPCLDQVNQALGATGRIVLRYSGTESLARVMIEGPDQDKISKHTNAIADVIRKEIGHDNE